MNYYVNIYQDTETGDMIPMGVYLSLEEASRAGKRKVMDNDNLSFVQTDEIEMEDGSED